MYNMLYSGIHFCSLNLFGGFIVVCQIPLQPAFIESSQNRDIVQSPPLIAVLLQIFSTLQV
ncbi:hypothetical protein HRbin17_01264 [bacterium HR17]|jgi:hypothetical protein|uniref:Uncharacterized protein n=1 Tax=Candidatus Fervidibacter japonicus TaxID=2035412 RepID=A0A2H5XC25_9BACT|nr:hypothetical protein HRbin17_01264 [bacterium HR17]